MSKITVLVYDSHAAKMAAEEAGEEYSGEPDEWLREEEADLLKRPEAGKWLLQSRTRQDGYVLPGDGRYVDRVDYLLDAFMQGQLAEIAELKEQLRAVSG